MQFSSITLAAALFLVTGSSAADRHLHGGEWSTDTIDSDATTSGHYFEDFLDKEEFNRVEEYATRNEKHLREDIIQELKNKIEALTELNSSYDDEEEGEKFDEEQEENLEDDYHPTTEDRKNRIDMLRENIMQARSHGEFNDEKEDDSVTSIQQDRIQELKDRINSLKDTMESRTINNNDARAKFGYENEEQNNLDYMEESKKNDNEEDEMYYGDQNHSMFRYDEDEEINEPDFGNLESKKDSMNFRVYEDNGDYYTPEEDTAAAMDDRDHDHQDRINTLKKMFSRSFEKELEVDESNDKLQEKEDTIFYLQNKLNSLRKVLSRSAENKKRSDEFPRDYKLNALEEMLLYMDDTTFDLQNRLNSLKKVLSRSAENKKRSDEFPHKNKLNALEKMLLYMDNTKEEDKYGP